MSMLDVLSGKPRVITYRTRQGWHRLGRRVKPGAEGWLVPFVPTHMGNIHIRRVRVFHQDELEAPLKSESAGPPVRQQCEGFKSVMDLCDRQHGIYSVCFYYRQGYGAARKKSERFIDQYWFVQPTDRMVDHDFDNVPRRRTVIYPASSFKYGRAKKAAELRLCQGCYKPFLAKRVDARYCGTACRKWASRQPSRKPENDGQLSD